MTSAGDATSATAARATVDPPADEAPREDPPPAPTSQPARPSLLEAAPAERNVLHKMLGSESWPRRLIACMRLERYGCDQSTRLLLEQLGHTQWQVRNFAIRALARRGAPAQQAWFIDEAEPRVIRTALRHGYELDEDRIMRGVKELARSGSVDDRMLAIEIAAATGNAKLEEITRDTLRILTLRMRRNQSGILSPRLGVITGQRSLFRPFDWQQWYARSGSGCRIYGGRAVYIDADPNPIAELPSDAFAALDGYIVELGKRRVQLVICLDATASMGPELAQAQTYAEDMMNFIGAMVYDLRVGLVAYRDRRDPGFETTVLPFTRDAAAIRDALWSLEASGGGDRTEAVYLAMRRSYNDLTWQPDTAKTLVLVGDAPPHVGHGVNCVGMARHAFQENGLVTHIVQTGRREVPHFPEIAEAGGGRLVRMAGAGELAGEITGLTIGDRYQAEFRSFFEVYLELCR
jgi:hypothetical protein